VSEADERISPYHPGELAVQERAGVRNGATRIGAIVADALAPALAHFLARRYTLYLGSLDAGGRPWASELVGPPGFVTAVGPRTLRIDAAPAPGDPLLENLRANPQVGILAIDLATRRRCRVNGLATVGPDGVVLVDVAQAYGNCPKYIQRREPIAVVAPSAAATGRAVGTALTPPQQARIARADTFFLATAHPTAGADVSHRGGRPGFVRVVDERRLEWPDYQGNQMFMSLGNLAVHPRAGLLVVDFETGDVLQLTGVARIEWDGERVTAFPGAQRLVELEVEAVLDAPGASALRWRLVEPSPANP
jgi:hypothetical protein